MKFLLIVFTLNFTNLFAQEIAITFDDAPRENTAYFNGETRANYLIKALNESQVPSIFFANSVRATGEGNLRLKRYSQAGFLIGNHTHSHPEINHTPIEDYVKNFLEADKNLAHLSGFSKWFRFPFLREGDTEEKRDRMRESLVRKGYQNAYITVNNYDWYMDVLFQKAIAQQKKINFDSLKKTYLEVLIDSVEYYDEMAKQVVKRSPKHVLLLHENDLAALFIKDLVKHLRKKGWKIITPQEAYTDKIATYKTAQLFPANPGRIGEIAKDKGWQGKLWHKACNEDYLTELFQKNNVY